MAAGISLGAAAVEGLHAQAKRAGYVVAEINVNDQDGYMKEFLPPAVKAIEQAGGKYVVRGGKTVSLQGEAPPSRVVILRFESMDKAQASVQFSGSEELPGHRRKICNLPRFFSRRRPLMRGAYGPLIVPFRDGKIDFGTIGKLIERQITEGNSWPARKRDEPMFSRRRRERTRSPTETARTGARGNVGGWFGQGRLSSQRPLRRTTGKRLNWQNGPAVLRRLRWRRAPKVEAPASYLATCYPVIAGRRPSARSAYSHVFVKSIADAAPTQPFRSTHRRTRESQNQWKP